MTRTAALLVPTGPAAMGVYVEHGEGATPFSSTPGGGGETRVFRAELRAATGAVLAPLALELPGEEPDVAAFPGEAPEGHAAREARWAAAHANRARLLAAPESFPELLLPGTAGELLPPTVFAAGRFYRIPCPRCLAPLRTCRDDARLAAAGLPLYSTGGVRVLACPACAGAGAEERFYAGDDGKGLGEKVGTLDELRRELAHTLEQRAADGTPVPEDVPRPAVGSGGRNTTVKKGIAGAAGWTVFNLHDSPYLVTRAESGSFDALAARLGGREDAGTAPGAGLLLALEGSGLDAVEVLALKLAAFEQAVAAVLRYGLLLGRPHLDLHPGAFGVEPGPPGSLLPALWSFRIRLDGGSGAPLARLAEGVEVSLPPRHPHPPFASPTVRNAAHAAPSVGELLLERATAEKGGHLFRLEGTLLDPHGFFPPLAPRDTVQIVLPHAILGGLPPLAARLDPRGRAQSVEAPLTTEPVELAPELAKRLTQSGGLRVPGVRYRIYPALGTAEDLYALGMLLLSLLLTHDGQSLPELEPLLAVTSGRERSIVHSAEEILAGARTADPDRLGKHQLFARREDRLTGRPNAVPDELWTEALLLALRLLTRDPVFGLPGPGDIEAPLATPGALEEVRAQTAELFRRATGLLFRRQSVHVEVQAALAELLAEVAQDERAGRPGTDRIV